MSFKKRFLKKIEEDKKSMYTESDRAFLATLQDMVVERPEGMVKVKRFNYGTLIISVACFLVTVLTISLILIYLLQPKPNDIFYLADNMLSAESNKNELNEDLELFYFEADENRFSIDIVKNYDSISSDTLFYSLKIKNATTDFNLDAQIVIVVNKNYHYPEQNYGDEILEATISNYTIKYTQTVTSVAPSVINRVECKGEMQVGTQWIYITTYRELAIGEGAFLETLQQIIHINDI